MSQVVMFATGRLSETAGGCYCARNSELVVALRSADDFRFNFGWTSFELNPRPSLTHSGGI